MARTRRNRLHNPGRVHDRRAKDLLRNAEVAAIEVDDPLALEPGEKIVTLRSILGNIGVHIVPDQVCIPKAYEAFDEAGQLKDEKKTKHVAGLAMALVELACRLKAASPAAP